MDDDNQAPGSSLERRTQALIADLLHVLIPEEVLEEHPHLADTPRRAASWLLQYSQPATDLSAVMRVFKESYSGMILEKDIPFTALCAHHLLPFQGKAAVAYIPNESIAGLSKLTRVVHFYAERVTLQEKITTDIVEGMTELIHPRFICAYLYDVTHGCMTVRGVKASHTLTSTFSARGPEPGQVTKRGATRTYPWAPMDEQRFWEMMR